MANTHRYHRRGVTDGRAALHHEEIQAFTTKLEAWEQSLDPREATLLRALVARPPSTEDEDVVEGFGYGTRAESIHWNWSPTASFRSDLSTPKIAHSLLSPLAGDEQFLKIE